MFSEKFTGAITTKDNKHIWYQRRRRLAEIPEAGTADDMVKRNGTMLVPKGDLILLEGDHLILYSQERISHASTIQI